MKDKRIEIFKKRIKKLSEENEALRTSLSAVQKDLEEYKKTMLVKEQTAEALREESHQTIKEATELADAYRELIKQVSSEQAAYKKKMKKFLATLPKTYKQ